MENLELDLKLTVAHVNTILKHLGAGVYAEVAEIVQMLHGQAQPQIQASTTNVAPAATVDASAPSTEPAPAPDQPAQ
jgi:hypothetical protein